MHTQTCCKEKYNGMKNIKRRFSAFDTWNISYSSWAVQDTDRVCARAILRMHEHALFVRVQASSGNIYNLCRNLIQDSS